MFLGASVIANSWLQIPEAEYTLMTLSPAIFFVSISSVIRGYFNGRECVKVTANSQSIEQTFKTLLTIIIVEIIAVISGVDTTIMASGANLATTLSSILCFAYLYMYYASVKKEIAREVKNTVNYKYKSISKIIKEILLTKYNIDLPILYGGSINEGNINELVTINNLDGYVLGESSKDINNVIAIYEKIMKKSNRQNNT